MTSSSGQFIVFACNWDGLSCVETVSHMGLSYSASVKVVRVSCLSRVHLGMILKAFELGAAGVMLLGCEPSECNYGIGQGRISEEFAKARGIMHLMGIASDRLTLVQLARGDGRAFVDSVREFIIRVGDVWSPCSREDLVT